MKWKRWVLAAFLSVLMPAIASAGEINAEEQEVLAVAGGTFEYKGVIYQATAEYLNQARAKLMQDDVDLTREQAEEAIASIYANVQTGIEEGYIVPVSHLQEAQKPEDRQEGEEASENEQNTSSSAGTDSTDNAPKEEITANEEAAINEKTEEGIESSPVTDENAEDGKTEDAQIEEADIEETEHTDSDSAANEVDCVEQQPEESRLPTEEPQALPKNEIILKADETQTHMEGKSKYIVLGMSGILLLLVVTIRLLTGSSKQAAMYFFMPCLSLLLLFGLYKIAGENVENYVISQLYQVIEQGNPDYHSHPLDAE